MQSVPSALCKFSLKMTAIHPHLRCFFAQSTQFQRSFSSDIVIGKRSCQSVQHHWLAGVLVAATLSLTGCSGGEGAASGADVGGMFRSSARAMAAPNQASWGAVTALPLVPASAANLPDGKVMFWSSDARSGFGGGSQAYTLRFDPAAGAVVSERLVNETGQNMFCEGTCALADGRLLISGGSESAKTSIYNPVTDSWSAGGALSIPRAYHANTLLQDGSVFTLGGSWAGGGRRQEW